jgi:addiction module HigA family antidote
MAMKKPIHPGSIVRKECIEASEMTVTDTAALLGVARQTLNNLVTEKAALSPEMAIRLEKVGWSKADIWMRLHMNYDLAQVRARQDEIIVQPEMS